MKASKSPRTSVDLTATSAIGKAAGRMTKPIKGPKKPKNKGTGKETKPASAPINKPKKAEKPVKPTKEEKPRARTSRKDGLPQSVDLSFDKY